MGVKWGPDGLANIDNNLGEFWIDFDPRWFVENLSEGPFFKDLSFISGQIIQDIFDYKRGIDFSSAPGLSFKSRLYGQQSDVKNQIAIPNNRDIEEKVTLDNKWLRGTANPRTVDDYCHIYDDDDPDFDWTGEYAALNYIKGGGRWNHLLQMEIDGFTHSTPITDSPHSPGEHLRYDGEVCFESEWRNNLGAMDVHLNFRKLSWAEESEQKKLVCVDSISFAMGFWPKLFFPILMESVGLQTWLLNLETDKFGDALRQRFPGIQLDTTEYERIE